MESPRISGTMLLPRRKFLREVKRTETKIINKKTGFLNSLAITVMLSTLVPTCADITPIITVYITKYKKGKV